MIRGDLADEWLKANDPKYRSATRLHIAVAPLVRGEIDALTDVEEPLPFQPAEPAVYFIQAIGGGAIKIGHCRQATRLPSRLAQIQISSPAELRIVRAVYGGITLETKLHKHFARARLRSTGEWFAPVEELVALARAA